MRTALVLAWLLLLTSGSDAAPAGEWTHTRALSPGAADLLSYAAARAPVVRGLLETLEASDVVVYVTDITSVAAGEPLASLQFVSYASRVRYLLVRIAKWELTSNDRVAWLAHELQHAVEIAAAPDVIDHAGVARLYERIGWRYEHVRFESDAARRIGRLAMYQMQVKPR